MGRSYENGFPVVFLLFVPVFSSAERDIFWRAVRRKKNYGKTISSITDLNFRGSHPEVFLGEVKTCSSIFTGENP